MKKMGKEGSAMEEKTESRAEATREGDITSRKNVKRLMPPRKMRGRG